MAYFQFSLRNGEIILNDGALNLGGNCTNRMPIVPVLYYKQERGRNLFQEVEIGNRTDLGPSLVKLVQDTKALMRDLPVSEEDFNRRLPHNLQLFWAANGKLTYAWRLEKKLLSLYLHVDKKDVLALNPEQARKFVVDYLGFIRHEESLESEREELNEIMRQLKDA